MSEGGAPITLKWMAEVSQLLREQGKVIASVAEVEKGLSKTKRASEDMGESGSRAFEKMGKHILGVGASLLSLETGKRILEEVIKKAEEANKLAREGTVSLAGIISASGDASALGRLTPRAQALAAQTGSSLEKEVVPALGRAVAAQPDEKIDKVFAKFDSLFRIADNLQVADKSAFVEGGMRLMKRGGIEAREAGGLMQVLRQSSGGQIPAGFGEFVEQFTAIGGGVQDATAAAAAAAQQGFDSSFLPKVIGKIGQARKEGGVKVKDATGRERVMPLPAFISESATDADALIAGLNGAEGFAAFAEDQQAGRGAGPKLLAMTRDFRQTRAQSRIAGDIGAKVAADLAENRQFELAKRREQIDQEANERRRTEGLKVENMEHENRVAELRARSQDSAVSGFIDTMTMGVGARINARIQESGYETAGERRRAAHRDRTLVRQSRGKAVITFPAPSTNAATGS